MAKIALSIGDKFLREVPLTKERVTIGRRPHNDIVLDDLAISGEHAVIVTLNQDSYLEDLNSTNGTQVNGQPVKKHYLRDDDCIELAQYRVRYLTGDIAATGNAEDRQAKGLPAKAMLRVLNGPTAGRETTLGKAITSLGKQELQTAVILRRPDGYFLAHVEGSRPLVLNGQPIGKRPQKLLGGDIIDMDGDQIQFLLY